MICRDVTLTNGGVVHLLTTLAQQGEARHVAFERRYSLPTVVSTMAALPAEVVEQAIKRYQGVIRSNHWFFPSFRDVDLASFLARWDAVHAAYFTTAEEIFARLVKGEPVSSLADADLLTRVIHSETMRGWVGKRSPSGLDALLRERETQLEELLAELDDDVLDEILSGGVYPTDGNLISAEQQMVRLFARYHQEVGQELDLGLLTGQPNPVVTQLLRDFCRYSPHELNRKYLALRDVLSRNTPKAPDTLESLMAYVPATKRDQARALLEEIRVLNYLNLNLEVRYSFKGWAGLMHILVFAACSDATDIETDVYAMRAAL